VPKLRERKSDIPLLATHILHRIAEECDVDDAKISEEAMDCLKEYHFPGNVRELENVIERAFTLCEADVIEVSDLQLRNSKKNEEVSFSKENSPRSEDTSLEDYLEGIERKAIEQALEETRWNKTAAAKKLGITFRALRYRLKKLDME
jgi:two-component system response regulator PilR (NtrC family)